MVILGGLEIVAAGWVLNELHKDEKKDAKPRRKRSDDSDRKHHRRRDSPHRQSRPQQQGLRPPQTGPPRPYSAPPPGSRPMWQPQPQPQPQLHPHPQHQQWQQQQLQQYPRPPQQQWQPQQHPPPQPPLQQQRPINYPPPGVHIDMKTGQVQHNMLPPDMQPQSQQPRSAQTFPQTQSREALAEPQSYVSDDHHERLRSESDFYNPARPPPQPYPNYSQSQPLMQPMPSPRPGYMELDAETPGRYRPDVKSSQGPSHVRIAVPGKEDLVRPGYANSNAGGRGDEMSPPPAYRE